MKLKAFTVIELLVAMIITGVVVTIGGFVWNFFEEAMLESKQSGDAVMELVQADYAFREDFLLADSITYTTNEICLFESGGTKIACYFANDSFLVRRSISDVLFRLPGTILIANSDSALLVTDIFGEKDTISFSLPEFARAKE